MEEKQMTAVQWLVYQLNLSSDGWMGDLINQAKQMEKEHIINSIEKFAPEHIDAEQYYNQTYKNK